LGVIRHRRLHVTGMTATSSGTHTHTLVQKTCVSPVRRHWRAQQRVVSIPDGGRGDTGRGLRDVRTISRGCLERRCSNKTTPPYHSNLSFVTVRNRRHMLLRAPAYRLAFLLLVVCALVNRPCILPARLHCPHWCNAIA